MAQPGGWGVTPDSGRLFVALDLDQHVRTVLASWRADILAGHPEVKPVAEDALHVTLCFLGTFPMDELDAIAEACAAGRGALLSGLRLGPALWLPRRRPRVLAVGVEDDTGALARVQSALARALQAGGWYRPEARPYLAHVTVARVGKDQRLRVEAPPSPPPVVLTDATRVTLYRSHVSPKGSRYEAMRTIPL